MIRFVVHQFRHACRVGLGRRQAIKRAVRTYFTGF